MHSVVMAKIALEKGKKGEVMEFNLPKPETEDMVSIYDLELEGIQSLDEIELRMIREVDGDKNVPIDVKLDLLRVIKGKKVMEKEVAETIKKYEHLIKRFWSKDLVKFILKKAYDVIDYEKVWEVEDKYIQEKEVTVKLLRDQVYDVYKKLELDKDVFYDLEKLVEGHRVGFTKKFLKFFKEVELDKKWPKELKEYMEAVDNVE